MNWPGGRQNRAWAWVRWLLFAEGLLLLLAVAGPGHRHSVRREGDHALVARFFIEDPSYVEAVLLNFVVANLLVACALFAAWLVTRMRRKAKPPSGEAGAS